MTFLAVITIAGIAVPILERTSVLYRRALYQPDSTSYDVHLAAKQVQFRLDLRMVLARIERLAPRWFARLLVFGSMRVLLRFAEIFFISALMQAALALPMAVYFHRATTLALPANVAVVPVMSFLLPVAVFATLTTYVGAWLEAIAKLFTALLLHIVRFAVFTFSHFKAADLRVPTPSLWASCVCVLAVGLCMLTARRRSPLFLCSLIALALSDVFVLYARKPDIVRDKLEVTAIDVGQGDSLLIVTPEGKTLLVDGGGTLGPNTSGFDMGGSGLAISMVARLFAPGCGCPIARAWRSHRRIAGRTRQLPSGRAVGRSGPADASTRFFDGGSVPIRNSRCAVQRWKTVQIWWSGIYGARSFCRPGTVNVERQRRFHGHRNRLRQIFRLT